MKFKMKKSIAFDFIEQVKLRSFRKVKEDSLICVMLRLLTGQSYSYAMPLSNACSQEKALTIVKK